MVAPFGYEFRIEKHTGTTVRGFIKMDRDTPTPTGVMGGGDVAAP